MHSFKQEHVQLLKKFPKHISNKEENAHTHTHMHTKHVYTATHSLLLCRHACQLMYVYVYDCGVQISMDSGDKGENMDSANTVR